MSTEMWQRLPPLLLERLQKLLPDDQFSTVMSVLSQPRPTTFRANTLKNSAEELAQKLTAAGVTFEQITEIPDAFLLTSPLFSSLTQTDAYKQGELYVQSLSSMIPAFILNPQPNEQVLDLTAAPGSKTSQMAALMNNSGQIVANDISQIRMYKLLANIKQQGVTNTITRRRPGQELWKEFPEFFDKVLVDAPCSMEGRIFPADPDSYADWSIKKIEILSVRQQHLLRSAVTSTKPSGVIVYSTCTLAPEENEAVVNWLLQKEKGRVVLEEATMADGSTIPEGIPGLTEWQGQVFDAQLTMTRRILPSKKMEGFFVAKLRKLSSTLPLNVAANLRPRQHSKKFSKKFYHKKHK